MATNSDEEIIKETNVRWELASFMVETLRELVRKAKARNQRDEVSSWDKQTCVDFLVTNQLDQE